MRRILFAIPCLLALLTIGIALWADSPALPPFTIEADSATINTKKTPKSLVYEDNVKFTSSQFQTLITCNRLEANAGALNAVNTVKATGNVIFAMTVNDDNGKPEYKLNGATPVMYYAMQNGEPVIRLEEAGGVLPSLVITDLGSKEKTDLTGTGRVIEYNLKTQTVRITKVKMSSEGSGK